MKPRWYVCDIDDGVLRVVSSRQAARDWALDVFCATRAQERPGGSEHTFTLIVDGGSADVIREDQMTAAGYDPHQQPLYPLDYKPFQDVQRFTLTVPCSLHEQPQHGCQRCIEESICADCGKQLHERPRFGLCPPCLAKTAR